MPEGKSISIQPGEYPELDGLKPGQKFSFSGTAIKEEGAMVIESMQFKTESVADKSYKEMRKQDSMPMQGDSYPPGMSEEF